MQVKRISVLWLAILLIWTSCGCRVEQSAELANGETSWQEQYDLGVRYLEEGNYEEAIIAFSAAIEIDPKRAEAYVGRGDAYVLSGETEENLTAAQSDYEASLGLDVSLEDVRLKLADIYTRQGELAKAAETLRTDEPGLDQQKLAAHLDELLQENVDIAFEAQYLDNFDEYAIVTATDKRGNLLWEYETPAVMGTELSRMEEIGRKGNGYFFNEGGTVTALEITTGEVLWRNEDFAGASISAAMDDDTIYLSGHYGPDFFAVSMTGETLARIESFDADYYWPGALELRDGKAIVSMTMGPGGEYREEGYPFFVDLNSWSVERGE